VHLLRLYPVLFSYPIPSQKKEINRDAGDKGDVIRKKLFFISLSSL
jgi:hypothetical protein